MISSLSVRDFKSLPSVSLKLADLNLLSGTNSSGKSSVIQALLLAADNLVDKADNVKNMTSSHIPAISFNESRNYITNAKKYDVGLSCGDLSARLEFMPRDEAFIATVVCQTGSLGDSLASVKNMFHLSAMRSGDLSSPKINPDPDANPLGANGEYLIDYYYAHRKDLLDESLIFYKEIKTLEGQVNYWLKKLTDYTLTVESSGSEYKVRYVTVEGKSLHPYNVGTGVNFITETLIACLASPVGGIVIIENPEIHLHPTAQADVLDFFVCVANSGIQVIVESHSDHLFNGIRRSIKQNAIDRDRVAVYNFNKKGGLTDIQEVRLSPHGGVENYQPGMFDQFDVDLDAILG